MLRSDRPRPHRRMNDHSLFLDGRGQAGLEVGPGRVWGLCLIALGFLLRSSTERTDSANTGIAEPHEIPALGARGSSTRMLTSGLHRSMRQSLSVPGRASDQHDRQQLTQHDHASRTLPDRRGRSHRCYHRNKRGQTARRQPGFKGRPYATEGNRNDWPSAPSMSIQRRSPHPARPGWF